MKIVFLVEERSMKECLKGLLPRVIPTGVYWQVVPHEGKTDLQKSMVRKLGAWNEPDVHFVIVRDKDAADCVEVKKNLRQLCADGRRPDSLIRIACHEMESWFLGDLKAVEEALGVRVSRYQGRFRNPDSIVSPSQRLRKLIPSYSKVKGARAIGPRLSLKRNCSHSYRCFVQGVTKLATSLSPPEDGVPYASE